MTDSPNTADIVERVTRHANVLDGDPRAATWVADLHEAAAIITELREAFALADSLVCSAIEHGFYVGEGLLDKLASARAALKDHRKAQTDEPIPGGVYWLAEADNFYCAKGGGGMGLAFYRKWRERANEFPTEASS